MMLSLLALGFLPGVATVGLGVLRRWGCPHDHASGAVERIALAITIGMILSLPLMVVSAALGWFAPAALGALGWGCTAMKLRPWAGGIRVVPRRDFPLLAAALLLAGWHTAYRTESIFSGRDQGVYANHAVHLAETGDLRVNALYGELFDGPNLALASALQAGGYFFDAENKNVYLQFAPTFALYLAQGYGIGGFPGLFAVNPLLAGLNVVLFFGLARRFVASPWAVAATALMALNLGQIWIARITLGEVLTQNWLLAGLVLLRVAWQQQHRTSWLLGGLLVAACTLIRVDAYLLIIALATTGTFLAQQPDANLPHPSWHRWAANLSALVTMMGIIAFFYGWLASPGYYADFASRIGLMVLVAAIMAGLARIPLPPDLRSRIFDTLARPAVTVIIMTGISLLALYAYCWRPFHEPFADFTASMGQQGRDYRENSLRDLGAYLSPVALLLSLGGLGMWIRHVLQRHSFGPLPLLGAWLAVTLLYLYNPYISTDHIWKIRRFIPVVMPGFALLAMVGLAGWVGYVKNRMIRGLLAGAGLASVFGWVLWASSPLAFTRLNDGATAFIQRIEQHVPPDALVVTDLNRPLLGPLQLSLGRDVVRALPGMLQQQHLVEAAIRRAAAVNRPIILLSRHPMVSATPTHARLLSLEHPSLVKTTQPPPRELETRQRRVFVSVLDPSGLGYQADAASVTLAANPIYGSEESGFMPQEYAGVLPRRWTDGNARLRVPWIIERPPHAAFLQIVSAAPGGSTIRLTINDTEVFVGEVPAAGANLALPVAAVDWTRPHLEVVIVSSTFVPAQVQPGSTDHRELGVQIGGLVLALKQPYELARWQFGLDQHARESSGGVFAPEALDQQPFRWTDGHARFQVQFPREHAPQRLSLQVLGSRDVAAPVVLRWNGTTLFDAPIATFPATMEFDLSAIPSREISELEIISGSNIPQEREPPSTDPRRLGIMLGPMHLRW